MKTMTAEAARKKIKEKMGKPVEKKAPASKSAAKKHSSCKCHG